MTAPIDQVTDRILGIYRSWNRHTPVEQMRRDWDAMYPFAAVEHTATPVDAGGVPALWIDASGAAPDRVIFFCHGGGFRMGSTTSHRDLMARLSAASGCRVLGIDYRLAPEHRFPAPVEDAVAAYRWLIGSGIRPERVAFAGDSAGGGLALSTCLELRAKGLPLPAAAVLMSPWTDLAATGASYTTRADADPIHQRPMILALAKGYLGDVDPHEPLASPLYGNLKGLPPLLIQVGDRETVLDDAVMLAEKARAAGVSVELDVAPGMIHVFQMFATDLGEAQQAIAAIGRFVSARTRA